MPKSKTQTGWVIAATEGATVDGRTITKAWINEMAETYSTDEYTAVIWPEHFRSSWGPFEGNNWGTVDEVKASKKGGKLRLFIKLTANDYLLAANKDGQKLFMSIEPNPDFQSSGKCYLQGLAVTDSPASTGTTRLKFSIGENEIEHDYSQLETLQYSDFIFTAPNKSAPNDANNDKQAEAKSLLTKLVNLFSITSPLTNQATEASDNAEDEPMTEAQYNALMGKFDGVTSQFNKFEEKFGALESKVEKFSVPGDENDQEADKDKGANQGKDKSGITAEQFSQLNTNITGLTEKFGSLETKFNQLSQESGDQEPDAAGRGETVSLV
ncbi:MAG: GPO family capsid scaffolding protein [Colwellia sp.]|nr:GPO family capsid scaffolding protein [Colwellia sp.]